MFSDRLQHGFCDGFCEQWRHGIPDLPKRGVHGSGEHKSVRKGLKSRSLADTDDASLRAVVVDVRISVLTYVSHEGSRRLVSAQFPPAVWKLARIIGRNHLAVEPFPFRTVALDTLLLRAGFKQSISDAISGRVFIALVHRFKNLGVSRQVSQNMIIDALRSFEAW